MIVGFLFFILLLTKGGAFPLTWTKKTPIVFAPECDHLKTQLAETCYGNRFLLMTDMTTNLHRVREPAEIRDNLRFILQLSLLMMYSTGMPVVQLDTTCTQYLSDKDHLEAGGHDKVVQALNLVRAFFQGGIGDVSHYEDWVVVRNRPYNKSISHIGRCINLIDTLGIRQPMGIENYHVGHACNILPYEEQMTRNDSISGKTYACSSHFLWVEDPAEAVHLCGVENPVGVVATDHTPHGHIMDAIERLNPQNHPGKLTLIIRMHSVKKNLPPLIDMVKKKNYHVVWCCDAVGGDPKTNLHHFLRAHQKKGTVAGGVYIRERSINTLDLIQFLSLYMEKTIKKPRKKEAWNRFSM